MLGLFLTGRLKRFSGWEGPVEMGSKASSRRAFLFGCLLGLGNIGVVLAGAATALPAQGPRGGTLVLEGGNFLFGEDLWGYEGHVLSGSMYQMRQAEVPIAHDSKRLEPLSCRWGASQRLVTLQAATQL